jgi:enoyl-[acyl-carrier protein] reductase II
MLYCLYNVGKDQILLLADFWKRGREFLGVKYAVLGGAMSWVSECNLVSAISNAGGFGIIACGSMNPSLLDQEIKKTKAKTTNNFGVNLITMHPQIIDLVDICINNKISHVVLAGGLPKQSIIKMLKDNSIKVICFAPTLGLAKKLIKMGADALIIEGSEAGGHIGPVSTIVLAQEILPHIHEVPIFVAGGIGRGETIMQFLKLGASGCQLGTRFVCAFESIAHDRFKKLFISSSARHAISSVQLDNNFPVIPVRAIANKATDNFLQIQKEVIQQYYQKQLTKEEAQLKIEHYWAGALKKAVIDGDVENGSVMAGQSVGMVEKEQSVEDIINELVAQAEKSIL